LPDEIIEFGIQRLKSEQLDERALQKGNVSHFDKEIQLLSKSLKRVEENLVMESDGEIRQMIKHKYNEIKIQIQKLNEDSQNHKSKAKNWTNKIIEKLIVIRNSEGILKNGTNPQKQRLLNDMGLNWKIKGKKISYEPNFVLEAVQKTQNIIRSEKVGFEPSRTRFNKGETVSPEQVAFVWSTLWELIRNSKII